MTRLNQKHSVESDRIVFRFSPGIEELFGYIEHDRAEQLQRYQVGDDASSNFAFAEIGMLLGIYVSRGFVWK